MITEKKILRFTPAFQNACLNHYNSKNAEKISTFKELPFETQCYYFTTATYKEVLKTEVQEMRKMGKSFGAIAQKLKISKSMSEKLSKS